MRVSALVLLLGAVAIVSDAQISATSQDSPVVVLKFSWSKERLGWQRDPFSGPIEDFDEVRARVRNEKRIDDAKKGGNSAEVDKIKREARADEANMAQKHRNATSRYVFIYKVTVKNGADKPVKSLDWDYLFVNFGSQSEAGHLEFTSEERIGPGKTKELVVMTRKPPTQAISVTALNKNEGESLGGQVVVMRIEYADGSRWQRAQ
ncbi:MAG: hypothetical protein M3R67_12535 [Acidobacteriota bacterium]|nr:hypothetical protein [Acidobacteriota bacterium]